jgi:simple sugar transport system ATP-binding protein
LILDEPTASLSAADASRLFAVVEQLSARGVSVVLISHRLGDLRRAAHRAVVLRDGRVVGDFPRPIDYKAALGAMVGRVATASGERPPRGPAVLRVDALRLRPGGPALSFALNAAEVTVLFGPLGAGKSRLLATLFGVQSPSSGTMVLEGGRWAPRGPAEAIGAGVFLAAEDRWRTSFSAAGTLGADIEGTIGLPHLPRWTSRPGLLPWGRQRAAAADAIARLGIVCRGPADPIESLSGGNQQKVVLARWSAMPARVLLLDEPFAGVDVRARHDIVAALRGLGSSTAVLLATSDAEEALEAADRILVMRADGLHEAASGDIAYGAALLAGAAARLESEDAA